MSSSVTGRHHYPFVMLHHDEAQSWCAVDGVHVCLASSQQLHDRFVGHGKQYTESTDCAAQVQAWNMHCHGPSQQVEDHYRRICF